MRGDMQLELGLSNNLEFGEWDTNLYVAHWRSFAVCHDPRTVSL